MKHNLKCFALACIFFTTFSSCLTSSNTKIDSASNSSDSKINDDQLNLANNYARDGLLREAVSTYIKVLASNPNHLTARRNMGLVLVKIGDYKQAAANLEKVVQNFQKDFDTSFYYAESLRGVKKYADAIFWYIKSLLIKSDDEKALKALAWSYFTIKYYSEALKTARHMYKLNPNDIQSTIIMIIATIIFQFFATMICLLAISNSIKI
ncbi:hypothetical protein MEO40_26310 [Dolichospermum sp. ST_sed1]|nr:hypothetical protein [Dolichospermum sp. ST_sed1]